MWSCTMTSGRLSNGIFHLRMVFCFGLALASAGRGKRNHRCEGGGAIREREARDACHLLQTANTGQKPTYLVIQSQHHRSSSQIVIKRYYNTINRKYRWLGFEKDARAFAKDATSSVSYWRFAFHVILTVPLFTFQCLVSSLLASNYPSIY